MTSELMTYGGDPDCTTRNLVLGVVVLCLLYYFMMPSSEYMCGGDHKEGLWGTKHMRARQKAR